MVLSLTRRPPSAPADASGDQIQAAITRQRDAIAVRSGEIAALQNQQQSLIAERREHLVDQELDGADHGGKVVLIETQLLRSSQEIEQKQHANAVATEDLDVLADRLRTARRRENLAARQANAKEADALDDEMIPLLDQLIARLRSRNEKYEHAGELAGQPAGLQPSGAAGAWLVEGVPLNIAEMENAAAGLRRMKAARAS